MQSIFTTFADLIRERIEAGTPTTEDSVRYTFFAALLENGVAAKDVVLEYPHPAIARAEVDTWLPSYQGVAVAIEFKYDRDPPGGKNQPRTQKAGSVFRDLRRLSLTAAETKAKSYFVYLTTAEMAIYFRNPNNGHHGLFGLRPGETTTIKNSYFEGKPNTFMATLGEKFEATLTTVMSRSLPAGYELRIYEVQADLAGDR